MNARLYILAVRINIIPVYYRNGLTEGFKWFGIPIPLEGIVVGETLFDYLNRNGFFKMTLFKAYIICTLGLIGLSIYLQIFPTCAIILWMLTGLAIISTQNETN